MDLVPILFYAAICAGLAVFVPQRMAWRVRAVIGAGVGVAAAALLPILRGATGL